MNSRLFYILTFVWISFFVSCNRTEITEAESIDDDMIKVNISLGGDYVDITSRPLLSKSGSGQSGKAYYAFQIDSLRTLNPRENDPFGTGWFPYSYADGLFDGDHISNLVVSLKKGHKYRIRCAIIIDQEDRLFVDGDNYVYEPFAPYDTKARIQNMFIYGKERSVWPEHITGYAIVNDNERVSWAKLDHYYGEAFTEGEPVTIQMDRYNFGLDFIIVAPQEGSLHVSNWLTPSFSFDLTPDSPTVRESHIYDIGLAMDQWNLIVPNPSVPIKLIVEWTKANGEVVDLSTDSFQVPNKTIMTIKVDINERIGGSDIGIDMPENIMDHSEVVIK